MWVVHRRFLLKVLNLRWVRRIRSVLRSILFVFMALTIRILGMGTDWPLKATGRELRSMVAGTLGYVALVGVRKLVESMVVLTSGRSWPNLGP